MIETADISRGQFAFTVAFHILYPAFSIGLGTFIMFMEAAYLATKNSLYLSICKYWMKIFALTFGMGVVSGLVMEAQLGTNWSVFSREVGPVLGGLFTYEVMTAFFIEAGFLGIMIFGWKKVGPKLHFLATFLVWVGVTLSAFWILAANSWMQTPDGATFSHGQFVVTNWHQVIFNHSTTIRFIHMLFAVYLTTAFAIIGIAALYLLRGTHQAFAKKCLSFCLWAVLILAPLQIYIGDAVGLTIHRYQPLKTAAIEANWNTQKGAPFVVFAYPDAHLQKNLYALTIPKLASLINTHKLDGTLLGLKSVPPKDQPIVAAVFYAFRIMLVIGFLMALIALIGLVLRLCRKLYDSRWFLYCCTWFSPFGFLAIITGWVTAECGRQPWVIYQFLRTDDAVSPVSLSRVIATMALIFIVYAIIFGVFYFRYLGKIIEKGPDTAADVGHPFAYMDPNTGGKTS